MERNISEAPPRRSSDTSDDDRFAEIEIEYNKMIGTMEENPEIAVYFDPFAGLFDFVYNEHTRMMNLKEEKHQIKLKLREGTAELETYLKRMNDNAQVIESMRYSINRHHRQIDEAHFREQAAHEIIDNLRRNIFNLQQEIDFKNKMAADVNDQDVAVTKHKQGIVRENEQLAKQISKLSEALQEALNTQEQLDMRTDTAEMKIIEIGAMLEAAAEEFEMSKRTREKLEAILDKKKKQLEELVTQESEFKKVNLDELNMIYGLEAEVKHLSEKIEKCEAKLVTCGIKVGHLQQACDKLGDKARINEIELMRSLEIKHFDQRELAKLHYNLDHCMQVKSEGNKQIDNILKEEGDLFKETQIMREQIGSLENQVIAQKTERNQGNRDLLQSARFASIIRKKISTEIKNASQQLYKIQLNEKEIYQTKKDMEVHDMNLYKQNVHIAFLEQEVERYSDEIQDSISNLETLQSDIRTLKIKRFGMKRRELEFQNKMQKLMTALDVMNANVNHIKHTYSIVSTTEKSLSESLRKTNFINFMLLSNSSDKEQLTFKSRAESAQLTKQRDKFQRQGKIAHATIARLRSKMQSKHQDLKHLREDILMQNRLIRSKNAVIETLVNEREVLGVQIDARNRELYLLYTKIRFLYSTSNNAQTEYNVRLKAIALCKHEITRLRQVKQTLIDDVTNMNDLETECHHLHVDLRREQLKSKSIEEELLFNGNIHRWRKLEYSDPPVFDLLKFIRILQALVVKNGQHIQDLQNVVICGHKSNESIQKVLGKIPGKGFLAKVEKARVKLEKSKNQEKEMLRELNVKHAINEHYNMEIARRNKKLQKEKLKLVTKQKSRQKDLQKLNETREKVKEFISKARTFGIDLDRTKSKLPLIK